MIGILGGGFGIYGYLPAAASLGTGPVLLPSRYQPIFSLRNELQQFSQNIEWIDSEQDLIEAASTLIISRRPIDQFALLPTLLSQAKLQNLILEKPFATTPAQALVMQQQIQASNKKCSVGFIFRYLPWAIELKKQLLNASNLSGTTWKLKWQFMAHHYKNHTHNWKRDHDQGGGVIRFYGIHIIALLAEWGYEQVDSSEVFMGSLDGDYTRWRARFSGLDLPDFELEIDTQNSNSLFILQNTLAPTPLHQSNDPFEPSLHQRSPSSTDVRCQYLNELLIENQMQVEVWPKKYYLAIMLWEKIEWATIATHTIK